MHLRYNVSEEARVYCVLLRLSGRLEHGFKNNAFVVRGKIKHGKRVQSQQEGKNKVKSVTINMCRARHMLNKVERVDDI